MQDENFSVSIVKFCFKIETHVQFPANASACHRRGIAIITQKPIEESSAVDKQSSRNFPKL